MTNQNVQSWCWMFKAQITLTLRCNLKVSQSSLYHRLPLRNWMKLTKQILNLRTCLSSRLVRSMFYLRYTKKWLWNMTPQYCWSHHMWLKVVTVTSTSGTKLIKVQLTFTSACNQSKTANFKSGKPSANSRTSTSLQTPLKSLYRGNQKSPNPIALQTP